MLCIGTTSCGFTFYLFVHYCKEKQGTDWKNYFELCNLSKVHVHVHWFSTFIILFRGYCNFNIASMYRMYFNTLTKLLSSCECFYLSYYTPWKNKVMITIFKRSTQYNSDHLVTATLFNLLSSNIVTQILLTRFPTCLIVVVVRGSWKSKQFIFGDQSLHSHDLGLFDYYITRRK